MADWRNISDTEVDPDAPVTSELAYAFRDNVIAMAEGASGSPLIGPAMNRVGNGTLPGSYVFAYVASNLVDIIEYGQVVAGSSLRPAAALNTVSANNGALNASAGRRTASLPGSWACRGYASAFSGTGQEATSACLFQRV